MDNIFREPAEPFILFSYCDFVILALMNIIIYFLLKKKLIEFNAIAKIIIGMLFFIIFPLISSKIEFININNKYEIVDGFNGLYVFLKIPIWWLIGILNVYIINKILKTTTANSRDRCTTSFKIKFLDKINKTSHI